ncbi:uridine kinase [Microbacterium sp. JZ37]|nr:uridine kinase [Microbacterium sp. JZ37]
MDGLSDRLRAVRTGERALVGIDGVDGSGKSVFADRLAARVDGRPVIVVHVDDFHHPRAVRYRRGRDSPVGFWLDSYDYDALTHRVLAPLRTGAALYQHAAHDLVRDARVDPPLSRAPRDAIVLVEGLFLHRQELRHWWDFSIFLDVPFEETALRMAERDGTPPDHRAPALQRYVGGQRLYFRAARPWEHASMVIDNSDVTRPRTINSASAAASREVREPGGGLHVSPRAGNAPA